MTAAAVSTLTAADPLRAAFAAAAASGDRLVPVGDAAGRLVGVVSDGDIRRAILAGHDLDEPLGNVLSPQPLTVPADAGDDETRALLVRHGVTAVAAVDADGRFAGVRRLDVLDPGAVAEPLGVLMVGGRGERLRPLTDKMPKPLLRIGGAAIVERLIASFRQAGVAEVVLTLNYLAEEFEEQLGDGSELGVRIDYVREREAMGTAGSLSMLRDHPATAQGRPLLVSNGDLVTTVDFAAMVDFHRYHRAAVTVAGVDYTATVPYGVLRTADHHLLHIDEKPTSRMLVSGGMYVLSPEVLRYVPADRPYSMPDLIDAALRDGLSVAVFPVLERWSDIGSKDEFERVLFEFAVEKES